MDLNENIQKEVHKHLTAPLPIQLRQPVTTKSALQFITQPPEDIHEHTHDIQELAKPINQSSNNRKRIHQIGDNFTELFKTNIYKNHESLSMDNNENFVSCKTNPNYSLNSTSPNNKQQPNTLSFESRFQSGNLAIAAIHPSDPKVYYLALQRDINSDSLTTQWFHFKVINTHNTGVFTFHIVNYIKPYSMFKAGMKPCVHSMKKCNGWKRDGFNIEYRKNSISHGQEQNYYTLTFSYDFTIAGDEVFFAYCYPYTYTRLQQFLNSIEVKHGDKLKRKIVAKTLGDNLVEMVAITNPQHLNKKTIFITARVHPGQTVSSYTCEAIITFLLSSHPDAQKLRNQFIIKIVPMLNPDGVINGNYRNSLSGDDLNRQWKNPNKNTHPQIFYLKKAILQNQTKKLLYLDLHGHSKKKASFMYGCVNLKNPYVPKELPYVLSKKMQHFNYYSCNFATPKNKEGTARITMWKAGIEHSYTYEISFCGPQKERRHFNTKDYQTMGVELCKNLAAYFYSRILDLQINEEVNKRCEELYQNDELMNLGNEETNGSSSELEDEIVKQQTIPNKTQKLFTRNHNATERSQTRRFNVLIQNFMQKSTDKIIKRINEQQDSNELIRDKSKGIERDNYFRHRHSFGATKVNIQQLYPQQQPGRSTFYGFSTDKTPSNKQMKSASLRNNYDSSLLCGQEFGVLLPNMQKGQYKRYQRYKKEKTGVGVRSASVTAQTHIINPTVQTKMINSQFLGLMDRVQSRGSERTHTKF